MSGSARQASRSVVHLSPPFAAANAASFSRLRPSNTGSGTRRSPLASGSPPSLRIAISDRRCCVLPSRPVAPSTTMPILRVAIGVEPLLVVLTPPIDHQRYIQPSPPPAGGGERLGGPPGRFAAPPTSRSHDGGPL